MKRVLTVVTTVATTLLAGTAMAQGHGADAAASTAGGFSASAALALTAGLTIAIAAFGGALAQGKAASTALEGIARNPDAASKIQTPMIIALALIESLVIYALVIAFLLQGKI